MTFNIRRLRSAVNWVKQQEQLPDERRRWDQGVWFRDVMPEEENICKTACCVAGNLVSTFGKDTFEIRQTGTDFVGRPIYEPFHKASNQQFGWDSAAAVVLGLEPSSKDGLDPWLDYSEDWETTLDALFSGGNTAWDVEELARELAEQFDKTL